MIGMVMIIRMMVILIIMILIMILMILTGIEGAQLHCNAYTPIKKLGKMGGNP